MVITRPVIILVWTILISFLLLKQLFFVVFSILATECGEVVSAMETAELYLE